MSSSTQLKRFSLWMKPLISLGIFLGSLAVGYIAFAWTSPTVAPPNDNVPAPINVSGNAQYKTGNLYLGAASASPFTLNVQANGADLASLWVDNGTVLNGNSQANSTLSVGSAGGNIQLCLNGDCRSAWPASGGMSTIAKTVLTSSASSITFSNIPQPYTNLKVEIYSGGDSTQDATLTGGTYHVTPISLSLNDGSAPLRCYSSATPSGSPGGVVGLQPNAILGQFGGNTITIFSYAKTNHNKITTTLGGAAQGYAIPLIIYGACSWDGTVPITTVKIFPTDGHFVADTEATLYGY